MANARGKTVDKTFLSVNQAEHRGFLHRDYIAHCLRWSHVVKYLMQQRRYATSHVLDIGCGRELPLAKMMFSSRMTHRDKKASYTGVDVGPIDWPDSIPEGTNKFNTHLYPNTDVVAWAENHKKRYDVITCFEVVEHVEPFHAYQMLAAISKLLKRDGVAFISTPNFDARMGAAANHVNEMTWEGLSYIFRCAGLELSDHWGTFASQRDYKEAMGEVVGLREIFDELREYYDSNVLSCIFAPLFPTMSRNILWRMTKCKPSKPEPSNDFKDPRHSSSDRWTKDVTKILKATK